MSSEDLEYEDLRRIIELVQSAPHIGAIRLRAGAVAIDLRKQQAASAVMPAAAPVAGSAAGAVVVRSPLVGTFHRGERRGARPFVEVGTRVAPETTVCMVEVLGEMSPISAGAAGIVSAMPVSEAAPVEFGQTLAVIAPQ